MVRSLTFDFCDLSEEDVRDALLASERFAPGPVRLRDYQSEAVKSVFDEWDAGYTSTLVCLPTGTGKSVVFSEIMRRWCEKHGNESRILVVAHKEELIFQAAGHARRSGMSVGIEMASLRETGEQVVISTVQTQTSTKRCKLCRGEGCEPCDRKGFTARFQKFNPMEFGLLVIDEAHHATAVTYRKVINWYSRNPSLKILLVTATPKRADRVGLHNVCQSVAYEMDISSAIAEGWLTKILQKFVVVEDLDLSNVDTKANGDFSDGELEDALLGHGDRLKQERMLHSIARPTLDFSAGKPALVFASGRTHAKLLVEAFNSYSGVRADLVLGDTPKLSRREIVSDFREGRLNVLVGCGVFTEGFDVPDVSVVAIARPTKSQALYTQMIGRGTRPLPGVVDNLESPLERQAAIQASDKPHCIILDFVGNSGRHKLVSMANLLAGSDLKDEDIEKACEIARASDRPLDMQELCEKVKQARIAREQAEARRREEIRAQMASQAHKVRAERISYSTQDINPFSRCAIDIDIKLPPAHPFDRRATESQRKFLLKLGIDSKKVDSYSCKQASAVISHILSRRGPRRVLTFGRYAGRQLADVPYDYLLWLSRLPPKDETLAEDVRSALDLLPHMHGR